MTTSQGAEVLKSSNALSEIWKPKYDIKDAQIEQDIMEPPPSFQSLQAMLQRSKQPYSDEFTVSVEVQGIYGIPEEWGSKIMAEDPTEQAYTYEVKALGCHLKGGKLMPKSDPDDSKEAEVLSGKDKKAPAGGKGKKTEEKQEVEELTPEEEERRRKEIEQRDRQNAQLMDEWNRMSEKDKFYSTAENKAKECYITFPPAPKEGGEADETVPTNVTSSVLDQEQLQALDSQTNDPHVRGCKIFIEKLVPQTGEDPKAKGGKKAAAGAEEAKSINGEAWLDLTPFMYPGAEETVQRCFIKTVHQKEVAEDGDAPPENEGTENPEQDLVFESRHCYVLVKVVVSEPINPHISIQVLPQSADIARNAVKKMPAEFPNVLDAVNDYQNAISAVVQEISIEYGRMFQGDEEGSPSPLGVTSQTSIKSQSNIYHSNHMRELREQRREKFLIEFNSSQLFIHLRQKLKKAIFRLALEKYNKHVDHKGLQTKAQKEQFKAELYTFLQEQMKFFLNQAIEAHVESSQNNFTTPMHNDLILSHKASQDSLKRKMQKHFKETKAQHFQRLSDEYDLIQDSEHAEWYIQNLHIDEQEQGEFSPERWFDYAKFCLKYRLTEKAELFMNRYVEEVGLDERLNLVLGAMYLQNQQNKKAQHFIHTVLASNWKHIHANLLMGFMFEAIKRPGLSRKHFAIAKVQRMRELNQLPPKNNAPKNFRTQQIEFQVEIIDYKTVVTKDQQMSSSDSDSMFFELINFLLDNHLFTAADTALKYIQDTHSNQYLITKAKIRVMQANYLDATQSLDELLSKNPDNLEAHVMRGHAYFLHGNLFDSEESFVSALRLKPNLKDTILQERLGIVYVRRKAWKDARTVFLKCCRERVSTTSWIYLGLSLLRLGELSQAEDAITQANILDNTNPKVWGMMTVLCLTTGAQRLTQGNLSFNQAIKLGLKDLQIMEEIGDLYQQLGELDQALIAYQMLASKIAPNYPEGLRKYAEVLEDPHCRNQNIDLAIDFYKRCLDLIDGDMNKNSIAVKMERLYRKMGRDAEIRDIQQYLEQDKRSGQISDDEDNDDDGSLF